MPFPQVVATNGGNNNVNSNNHAVNLPSGIQAGNLLLVFFTSDGNPTVAFPQGWTQLFQTAGDYNTIKFGAWYRIADGAEGATITVTTSNKQMTAHTSYRIIEHSGTPEVSISSTGYSDGPNPPGLTPSWGARDTLWFACCGYDTNTTVYAYPGNYTNGRNNYANHAEGCGVATARRELNADNENPSSFVLYADTYWVANIVAIKPKLLHQYSADTRRELTTADEYSADTLREIKLVLLDIYRADSKRRIQGTQAYLADTSRERYWDLPLGQTVIRIGDALFSRLQGSLYIHIAINRRSMASFTIVDAVNTMVFQQGQNVEIYHQEPISNETKLLFAGIIYRSTKQAISPSNLAYHTIECIDWHYLADKRLAAESYTERTAGYIVGNLFAKYLEPEGITIGEIQEGPLVTEMVVNYQPVSKALNALSERTGFIWEIDKYKKMFFVARTASPAPFSIIKRDIVQATPALNLDSPLYRNRQYIRAKDTTDEQIETFTGDGKTLSFTLAFPLALEPTITVEGRDPQIVGIRGVEEEMDWYWSKGDFVISAALPPDAEIIVKYYGQYNVIVLAEDGFEVARRQDIEGGTGYVEIFDDEPSLSSMQATAEVALARLSYYGVMAQQFKFSISKYGLLPGQLVSINHPTYGLVNKSLLIESMDISDFAPRTLLYSVNVVEGPLANDWTSFFSNLVDIIGKLGERLFITVGGEEILIISNVHFENRTRTEEMGYNVISCSTPSEDLYPSEELYPC